MSGDEIILTLRHARFAWDMLNYNLELLQMQPGYSNDEMLNIMRGQIRPMKHWLTFQIEQQEKEKTE